MPRASFGCRIQTPFRLIAEQSLAMRVRLRSRSARLGAMAAIGMLLVACTWIEPAPSPESTPAPQSASFAAPVTAPVSVPQIVPTQSPGAATAARQRAAFPMQEQLRAAAAERAAELRRQQAEQQRRELILREIARRADQIQASIVEEQHRRAARQQITEAACDEAQLAAIEADYRGELPSRLTRRVLAACDLPSATDRWEELVAILPEARLEWQTLTEAEAATWARAERVEAELRRAEAVRQRRAEIEAQILADQIAIDRLRQDPSAEPGLLGRVASALPAPLVQLVRHSVARLVAVPAELGSRAAFVNQRAQSGAVTALALAEKIPPGVRAAGEDAMKEFVDTRHVSHIESVSNNPSRAADPKNLFWEHSKWNLARGARNASAVALLRAHAHNAGAALQVAGPGILASTGQGCVIGAVMELPVAAAEQRRPVLDGAKTTEEAVLDAAKSTAAAGLTGCALTAAAAGAASVGVLSLGAPVLIPIAVAGGTVYVLTTSTRIWDSLSEEEQAAVLGQMDVSRDVLGDLTSSAWAATQDGGEVVTTAIQATADAAGWWEKSDQTGQDTSD